MVSLKSLLSLGLIGGAAAAATKPFGKGLGCGEVDVIFTGLPPFHPLVLSQGFNPAAVNASLRADAASIVNAGYNLRVVLMGPEEDMSILSSQLHGVRWDGTGVGYGVRGSRLPELTIRLEDIIETYREKAPKAPIMFNYAPDAALWAIQRHFPLSSNCTNSPGTDLGFNVFCEACG